MNDRGKIKKIVERYGHLLPENTRLDCYKFSELLKKHFTINNPIVFRDFNYIRNLVDLYWENRENRIRIIKI